LGKHFWRLIRRAAGHVCSHWQQEDNIGIYQYSVYNAWAKHQGKRKPSSKGFENCRKLRDAKIHLAQLWSHAFIAEKAGGKCRVECHILVKLASLSKPSWSTLGKIIYLCQFFFMGHLNILHHSLLQFPETI
jgi:hypothetical protein